MPERILDMIPDCESLENEDLLRRQTQRFRLIIMTLLVLSAMVVMALEGGPRYPFVFWTASAVVLAAQALKQHAFLLGKNIPLEQWKSPRIGLFLKEKVEKIYDEISSSWEEGTKTGPVLYISSERSRPAFTVRNCFTSDPRFQAIYLSEDLFFWLKSEELKGVLAHEMAHYHRYSGAMMRCYPLVLAIMSFLPLTLIELLNVRSLYLMALLWPVLHYSVYVLLMGLQRRDMYWQEYLADAAAVRISSDLHVVNGLLLIHRRMDNLIQAYRQLLRLLKKNSRIPLTSLDQFVSELWAQLPRRVMSGQTVKKVVADLFETLVKSNPPPESNPRRRSRQIVRLLRQSRPRVRRHFDWATLRGDRHRWRLDEKEYHALVDTMLRQPQKQLTLFSSIGEGRGRCSHPLLRKRILFVHKNFSKKNTESS